MTAPLPREMAWLVAAFRWMIFIVQGQSEKNLRAFRRPISLTCGTLLFRNSRELKGKAFVLTIGLHLRIEQARMRTNRVRIV